jgi:hypothetical protein
MQEETKNEHKEECEIIPNPPGAVPRQSKLGLVVLGAGQ